MKLARVEHIRCDDQDGVTFVMAPDGIDEDKFQDDVTTAVKQYLQDLADFKARGDHPGWLTENLATWPDDITVGEIRRRVKENGEARAQYNEFKTKITHEFGWYLEKLGYTPLWRAEFLEAAAYWGHQHGENIKYSVTTVDFKTRESEAAGQPEVYPLKRKAVE